jgi:hypothetical protein
VGRQAFDELAVLRLAWDNCGVPPEIPGGSFTLIEAEFGLAMSGVHPVAIKTVLGKNGTDIPVEGERGLRLESGGAEEDKTANQHGFQSEERGISSPLNRCRAPKPWGDEAARGRAAKEGRIVVHAGGEWQEHDGVDRPKACKGTVRFCN